MDSGIVSYIRAFGVRWFVAMSGGLGVPLTVSSYFVAPDAAKLILFLTGVSCVVFSSYWIWKVEREARIAAETKANNQEKRKNIRVTLASFHDEGKRLMNQCCDETKPLNPAPNNEANAWAQKAETFMSNVLDDSYITRFRDDSDIFAVYPASIPSRDHYVLWCAIRVRVIRLRQFIEQLPHD